MMRPLVSEPLLAGLIALSSLLTALYGGMAVYILVIIIYIIVINLVFIGKHMGGESSLSVLLVGSILVIYSIMKIINLYSTYLINISIAIVIIMMASVHWNEELVRTQYSAFYPISMITALIIGYSINSSQPFQLVLLSSLESHLVYHALSKRRALEGLTLAFLFAITIYSLYYLQSQSIEPLPLLGATLLLKVASGFRQRIAKAYAPLDFYIKVLAGGLRV